MWPRLTNRANPRVDSGAGSDHTGAASEVVTSSACTYAIRFILPDLSLADLKAVGEDRLSLDERTREYIRSRFTYRYALTDGRMLLDLDHGYRVRCWASQGRVKRSAPLIGSSALTVVAGSVLVWGRPGQPPQPRSKPQVMPGDA